MSISNSHNIRQSSLLNKYIAFRKSLIIEFNELKKVNGDK